MSESHRKPPSFICHRCGAESARHSFLTYLRAQDWFEYPHDLLSLASPKPRNKVAVCPDCSHQLCAWLTGDYPRVAGCCSKLLTSDDDLCQCEAVEE